MIPKFYEANLGIICVDGSTAGLISSNPRMLLWFLEKVDHEGSSISMMVRDTPDAPYREVDDPEQVYAEIKSWQ